MIDGTFFYDEDEIRHVLKLRKPNVEQLRQSLEAKALNDPEQCKAIIECHPFFLQVYLGFDVEPFHREGLDAYLDYRRAMWLAPRGSGKSTSAVVFVTWLSISNPRNRLPEYRNLFPDAPREITPANIRIALTSNSSEKAIDLHWQVRALLKNEKLTRLYGSLIDRNARDTDHKSMTSLRNSPLLREGTFTALGLGSKVTGGHYDVVLIDDWVTEDNARTELLRERLLKFWTMTVKPTCEPWSRVLGAGTRYHPKDFYQNVKQWVEQGLWHKLTHHRAVIEKNGKRYSYWPKAYSLEKLDEIREEIGSAAFETQYQNEVDILSGDFFDLSWFQNYYVWEELPAVVRAACEARTIISLDAAIKAGPKNDWSVFTVMSYAAPHFYLREIVRGQWTEDEHIEVLMRLVRKYRPRQIGVEVVGGMEFLVQRMRSTRGMPRIVALRPSQYRGKDKTGRASKIRSFLEQGRLMTPKPTTVDVGLRRLLEEALAFPTAASVPGMDDCVDSFVWALLLISRAGTRLVHSSGR